MSSRNSNSGQPVFGKQEPLGLRLERLYSVWNDPRYIHPDPLEMVRPFRRAEDREIAALLASSLAYGRVNQILKSVQRVLEVMGASPAAYLRNGSAERFDRDFSGFKHRFHTGRDLALLLCGIRAALDRYGTLQHCFLAGFSERDRTVLPAAERFVEELCRFFPDGESTLLPSPKRGSACKRLHLMLRWLVRKDKVDPGGWDSVPRRCLLIPLDTHMHRLARMLGLTARNAADRRTAEEVTEAFSRCCPEDPVRYDFVLTRFGIHPDFPRNPFENPAENP